MASEMTPEISLRLFKEGATFVFLDVPVGTEVGIDMQSWNTGEKFKGIKMIPPGLHFVYFSAVSKDHRNVAPRTGFFHNFRKGELLAKRYDPCKEDLSSVDVSDETVQRMKDDLENLDKFLGAYPYDMWRKWVSLTNHISQEAIERLTPPNGRILSAPELSLDSDQSSSSTKGIRLSKLEQAEQLLPKMSENIESKIRYSCIPTQSYPDGSTPKEITSCHLDKSWKLQLLIDSIGSSTGFLAELQFAFVNFLIGQSYLSFEHWKALVQLICHSDTAIVKFPSLYFDFLSDVYFQITFVPEDFFADIVTCNNFLFNCLQRLHRNIKDQDNAETKLKNKVDRFISYISSKFGWDFEDFGEEEPTVVEEGDMS